MSQRTLELAFQESLGITPRQYLRWHRMHNVYCELRASDAESATITDMAAHWGFTELGRFAVEYKQLYGESPSTTLGRRSAAPATRLSDALLE
jgi:AraC-like DNA-binding protein